MTLRNDATESASLWSSEALQRAWLADSRALGLSLDEAQLAGFAHYYDLLVTANRTTNLTRITAPEEFAYRSLLDSLALAPFIPQGSRVMDVGSGAGLPAVPLVIARPDIAMTALEATGKKCRFIESVQEAMGLSNLSVLHRRSEEAGHDPDLRGQFDVITARAVAPLPVLLELCLPLLKPTGVFLAMKGENSESELAAARKALHVLNGKLQSTHQWDLPPLERARLLIFTPSGPCPPGYPRPAGMPAKKPL